MQDVTKDRHLYIGGSDIPCIMGISPFKTRWELLQEKAQLVEPSFMGNIYTAYGNELEPIIRDYVNQYLGRNFVEDKFTNGRFRYHADGWDEKYNEVLEIKTTSQIHESLDGYKKYLVQLLFGMENAPDCFKGILAVYKRPDNFSTDFNPFDLQIFVVKWENYKSLIDEVFDSVDSFLKDLDKLKGDSDLEQLDFVPKDIIKLTNELDFLEVELERLKSAEDRYQEIRQKLAEAVALSGSTKWETNTMKITLIEGTEDTEVFVDELDTKSLKRDLPELWKPEEDGGYIKKVKKTKKGRKPYVRITKINND